MSKRLTVSVSDEAFTKLGNEARTELRPVRYHAAYLLEKLLTGDRKVPETERAQHDVDRQVSGSG